jgi:hypothetical protein
MTSDSNIHIPALGEEIAQVEERVEPIGKITPTLPQYRPSVFASQGISKKNIPNRHGLRPASDSAPAWSRRESLSIRTISGVGHE